MEQTECSETSEHKIQTPGNHSKERKQFDVCQTDVFQETAQAKLAPLIFFATSVIYCIF